MSFNFYIAVLVIQILNGIRVDYKQWCNQEGVLGLDSTLVELCHIDENKQIDCLI